MTISLKTLGIGSGGILGAGGVFGAGLLAKNITNNQKENPANKSINKKISIGQTSAKYTSDLQWMFLYKLGEKVFEYLKSQKDHSNIVSSTTENFISWLKAKLSLDIDSSASENWEKFKSICTKALESEDDINTLEIKGSPEVRLCFMGLPMDTTKEKTDTSETSDKGYIRLQLDIASKKGYLRRLQMDKDSSRNYPYKTISAFSESNWSKTNYELWKCFKDGDDGKKVTDSSNYSNFDTNFESWYKKECTENNGSSKAKKIYEVLNSNCPNTTSATEKSS